MIRDGLEVYASHCCGGLFVPGRGPDNICELPDPDAPAEVWNCYPHTLVLTTSEGVRQQFHPDFVVPSWDSFREGDCPACGAPNPVMEEVSGL